MDEDHAVDNKNVDSIFKLFNNLTGENNENPKFCLKLLNSLRGSEFNVGSGSNLNYSVKRLVRGLGSSRLYSQCGCFAALTCALKYGACAVENVLVALDKEQKPGLGITKCEIKALHTGCVLACGAIIHSGVFTSQSHGVQEDILRRLIEAGKTKSYLQPVIYQFVVDVVNLIGSQQFKHVLWPLCKETLLDNLNNPDAYYLLLICHRKHHKTVSKFIEKKGTVETLINNIANSIFTNQIKLDHPVYVAFADFICKNLNISKTWSTIVSEHARKDTALIVLFSHIIKNVNVEVIPELLIPKFIEVIIRQLSFKNKNKGDCLIAKTALNSMIGELCKDGIDEVRYQAVKKLLLYPANMKFEMRTGTKFVQTLVGKLSSDYVKKLANLFRDILNGDIKKRVDEDGTEELWSSKEKQHVMHMYTKTLNHPTLKNDLSWKLEQVKFIFEMSFIASHQMEVQKYAKESFYRAIMVQFRSLKDLVTFLNNLVVYINEKIGAMEVSEDFKGLWEKMYSVVETLKEKSNKVYNAVHVLLIYMGLYLFSDEELAKNGIDEIISCYERLKKRNKEDEPHWTEVTLDLILSLLSRENKLWRHVVSCVFPLVVPQITPTAMQLIINALDPKQDVLSNADSDSELEETSDSDSEEKEEEEEEDEDEYKPNDQLRLAVRNALGYSAAATDDESVDMDQMGSDEERRLNDSLSEAFRMFKAKQNTKKRKQSKEEETLLHFRLRVLDLIEIYITNSPSMGGCLDLLLPLLDLYEFSIKDNHQKPLQKRLDSVLKHLSEVKAFSNTDGMDQTIIKDIFQSVIGRRETSALIFVEMSPRITDAATFLVRCSQLLPKDGIPLIEEYDSLLQSFFHSRDLKIPISMFQSVLRISWEGNFKMAATLFELLSTANIRIFKKMKIIEMLQIFYKNDGLHANSNADSKSDLAKAEAAFAKNFTDLISNYDKTENQHRQQQLSFLSNIITLINVILIKKRTEMKKSPWKGLVLKMVEMEIINANKKMRCRLANIAHILNVPLRPSDKPNRKRTMSQTSVPEMEEKEENEEMEEEEEGKEEKKKKKKKISSSEAMKLKKESRKLRENFSSSGLEMTRFSAVDCSSLFQLDSELETNIPKKKRKKEMNGID